MKPTNPNKKAEFVSRYTSQLVARRVIHVPVSEIPWPMMNNRKLRERSARKGELNFHFRRHCEGPSRIAAIDTQALGMHTPTSGAAVSIATQLALFAALKKSQT